MNIKTYLALFEYVVQLTFTDSLLVSLLGMAVILTVLALLLATVQILSFVLRLRERDARESNAPTPRASQSPLSRANVEVLATHVTSPVVSVANTTNSAHGAGSSLVLQDVSEQDAALIMAIVADQCGVPVENLKFVRITRLD